MAVRKSLSSKVDSKGYAQVLLLVEKGRQGRFRLKSGVFVPTAYWNEKKNELTIPRKIGVAVLNELQSLRDELTTIITNIETLIQIYKDKADKTFIEKVLPLMKNISGTPTNEKISMLLEEYGKLENNGKTDTSKSDIFALAEIYMSKGFAQPRINLLRVILRSMIRFQYYSREVEGIDFLWDIDTTTQSDIERYFDYINNEYLYQEKYPKLYNTIEYNEPNIPKKKERPIEKRSNNRQVCMRKAVKSYWNWLIKTKRTTNNPFVGVEMGSEKYGTPFYLNIDERNRIADYDFSGNKSMEIQRDIYIFQCLIGCRVGDLYGFTESNIIDDMLVYTPHKTKNESSSFTVRVPLSEKAKALLAKYKGQDRKGRLFPFIAQQNYNYAIKDILKACGIDRMVSVRNPQTEENEMMPLYEVATSHMARRTFIGSAYKVVKDPNLIGKMSGHVEGSKAFVRYRDIDDDMLKEVINVIG